MTDTDKSAIKELPLNNLSPRRANTIQDTSEISQDLAAYDKDAILQLASIDMDLLAGLALGSIVTHTFPPVFLAIWNLLLSSASTAKDFTQLAIGLPRGFGKTTVIKLFIFWLVIYSTKKYILITASNQAKAERILGDVRRLFSSENIKSLFGNVLYKCETDRADLLVFNFGGRLITIQCLGSGGDPRGSNIGFARPDVILSDDIQSRENAMSPTQAVNLREWYYATLMPAKSELGCLYVYIGNMFATDDCLLKQFRDSPDWISFIAGALLTDGKSIWEEFVSTEQIYVDLNKAIRANTTHIFFSEVLNDSAASGNVLFDPSKLLVRKSEDAGLTRLDGYNEHGSPVNYTTNLDHQGAFVIIDPAGSKKNSDQTAIGVGVTIDGIPYLRALEVGVMTPLETIEKSIQLAMTYGAAVIVSEAYAYQESLLFWFDYVCKLSGIYGFTFLPITKGSKSKNSAILNMLTQLQKHEIGLYSNYLGAVLSQILKFNPQSTTNQDDILDVLVYLPIVLLKYSYEIGKVINQQLNDSSNIPVVSEEANCSF